VGGAVFAAVGWYMVLERLLRHQAIGLDLFTPSHLGGAFTSMAEYLLAGRFDIDPVAIGAEAFEMGDRTVSYFGIFCALLRMPLLPFPAWAHLDVARVSCLLALGLGTWFQLRAVLLVRDASPAGPRRDWLTAALMVCILLGGQQIQFLRVTLYQEVVDWGNALAMGFVLLAIRGVVRGFEVPTLTGMAAFAGFALIDRVTFGVGLYAALGGVLLLRWRLAFWPVVVLAVFVAVTGVVNYGRWGDPTMFADFTKYAFNQDQTPDRMGRIAAYGAFNWRRLGLGLSYYFVPVWAWPGPGGSLPFVQAKAALIDAMELPAGSFFLSDPLLLGLAAVGAWGVARKKQKLLTPPHPLPQGEGVNVFSLALLAGFAIPPILMLTAISMNYRYRVEFYPLFVFAALLGFRGLCRVPTGFGRKARVAIVAAVVVSVLASHGMAALYAVSPWGPADGYLEKDGWVGTYLPRLTAGHD
jgi:hypothetical protein